MPTDTGFFTKTLTQIITVIECMASEKGTTIKELTERLSLTRRSVFRLIRTIEHDLNIVIIVDRKVFGGPTTYRIPPSFVEKLSNITTPPLILTFRQAMLFYLISKDKIFQNNSLSENKRPQQM